MTIAEFFLKLATDKNLLQLYYEDREEAIRNAELGDEQRELLLSGRLGEIRGRIEVEFEIGGEFVTFVIVYVPPIIVYCPPSENP